MLCARFPASQRNWWLTPAPLGVCTWIIVGLALLSWAVLVGIAALLWAVL